jgi:DnaJ like chaperone protein
MRKFGKWIGAGLGWTIGGPIGAIIGFTFGSIVDASNLEKFDNPQLDTTTGDFIVCLLIVVAAIMKADKKVMQSELGFVKKYLVTTFGEEEASEMLKMLRNILKQEIRVNDVTTQIRSRMDYASRFQLMHLIFGIASADGIIVNLEILQLEQIALQIGIREADLSSLKNMFIQSTDQAYKILEIDRGATDEEVKKAYRKLALKNHPDKVAYLGDEIRKKAQEKFQKINEAYETIKKERGMN